MDLWKRHGISLCLNLIGNLAGSYQAAALYRHLAHLHTSPWSLQPAMFLIILIVSMSILYLLKEAHQETVNLALVVLGVASAFAGVGCRVLLIMMGPP